MKKLLVGILLVAGIQFSAKAQADIQVNPVAILWGLVQFSVEFPVGGNGGLEVDMIAGEGGFGMVGIGKYYMNPRYRADRFYIGGFGGAITDGGAGLGFIGGYKWLSKQGVSFELALGIGRGTGDIEVFPYGKLAVGYRFGNNISD